MWKWGPCQHRQRPSRPCEPPKQVKAGCPLSGGSRAAGCRFALPTSASACPGSSVGPGRLCAASVRELLFPGLPRPSPSLSPSPRIHHEDVFVRKCSWRPSPHSDHALGPGARVPSLLAGAGVWIRQGTPVRVHPPAAEVQEAGPVLGSGTFPRPRPHTGGSWAPPAGDSPTLAARGRA